MASSEIKAEDVALVGLSPERDEFDHCFVLLKNKTMYSTRLERREIRYLKEARVVIFPWDDSWMNGHFMEDKYSDDEENPTTHIRLKDEHKLRGTVDPNNPEAVRQYVKGWPCKSKSKYHKELAEARRKIKSYENKIDELKERVKELEHML
jgi:hypothetical protein